MHVCGAAIRSAAGVVGAATVDGRGMMIELIKLGTVGRNFLNSALLTLMSERNNPHTVCFVAKIPVLLMLVPCEQLKSVILSLIHFKPKFPGMWYNRSSACA